MNITECRSIAQTILVHAEADPEKDAVILPDAKFSYAQLSAASRKAALWLLSIGAKRGDRVVVEASHTFEYVAICYGAHLAGCIFAPLENKTPATRFIEVRDELGGAIGIVSAKRDDLPGVYTYADFTAAAETIDENSFEYVPHEDNEAIEILFTTGTTGKSKGVTVSARNQIVAALNGIGATNLEEDNVWLIPSPMNHAAGLRKMHMSMYAGSTVVLLAGFTNVKLFFEMIHKTNATSLYLPPSGIHFLLQLAKKELAALDGQLRFIYSSSAAYPQPDKDAMKQLMPHVRMYNMYGGSEMAVICSADFNTPEDREGSVGKATPYAKIMILDENYNVIENSSKDNFGYVAIQSDSVMLYYWNEPELTAGAKLNDNTIITSDYGYFDEDGFLILIGRANDVINFGGLKVAPNEVEAKVLEFGTVDECILIPAGKEGNIVLKLLVTMKEGCEFDQAALAAFLAANLEPYKLPKRYAVVPEIAKTFNGKIDRKKMIAQYK